MRLWSLHPRYLDWKGLGAVWREGLLAQAVLLGKTRGWKSHPQLDRFKGHEDPIAAIGFYLLKIQEEARMRGYDYNHLKVGKPLEEVKRIQITDGQLAHEYIVLMERLAQRAPKKYIELKEKTTEIPQPHPIFIVVEGDVEPWETGYWRKKKPHGAESFH